MKLGENRRQKASQKLDRQNFVDDLSTKKIIWDLIDNLLKYLI